jgi:hypothetical protein
MYSLSLATVKAPSATLMAESLRAQLRNVLFVAKKQSFRIDRRMAPRIRALRRHVIRVDPVNRIDRRLHGAYIFRHGAPRAT